VIAQHFYT